MTATSTPLIITQTQNWLQTLVIDLQLCPFANEVYSQRKVHYCINTDNNTESRLLALIAECMRLDSEIEIATSLFICPKDLTDFDDFLDFLTLAEELLSSQGYQGIYQLASFHPDYCFAEQTPDDPSNYTNRSPYPMLQLLREASIEQALENYTNPEQIPERNIHLTRQLGSDKLQALLAACLQSPPS